ncbi:hypothetical protein JB92DRAFT_3232125 [Gautieria morchelliformis]|nr:hypothetical protein JB92DRAFT_3232125 [Gautieria morchelliformis]
MSELPVPSVEPQTVPDNALTIASDFEDSVASGSIQSLLTSKLQCEEAVPSRGNWKKAADWLASAAELNPSLKQITSQVQHSFTILPWNEVVSGPAGKEIRTNDLSALLGPSMLSHSMVRGLAGRRTTLLGCVTRARNGTNLNLHTLSVLGMSVRAWGNSDIMARMPGARQNVPVSPLGRKLFYNPLNTRLISSLSLPHVPDANMTTYYVIDSFHAHRPQIYACGNLKCT